MQNQQNKVNQWLHDRSGTQLDDDGVAALQRDADTVIVLEVPEYSEVCHLYAPVAALPEDDQESALQNALALNRFGRPLGGCWLAWDPDVQVLTLCHNLSIANSDGVAFNNTLDNFLNSLDTARALFAPDSVPPLAPANGDHNFQLNQRG
jgi:hypothetical protein